MPKERVLQNFFPGPDSRNGCVHHHQARSAVGMTLGEGVGDHVANVVAHDVGFTNLQCIEDASEVLCLVRLSEALCLDSRKTHAPQVRGDDGVVAHKFSGKRRPHVARLPVPVNQKHRRTFPPILTCIVVPLVLISSVRKEVESRKIPRPLRHQVQDTLLSSSTSVSRTSLHRWKASITSGSRPSCAI
jgi:hypothetical protein